jgi:hypothetical protein
MISERRVKSLYNTIISAIELLENKSVPQREIRITSLKDKKRLLEFILEIENDNDATSI